jgi:NAD+ synthase (glutamine-hydrolysing)
MKLIKMGVGVLNQTPLDWDHNQRNIIDAIARARDQGVTILCLPEMCITGYGCEDAFHSMGVQERALDALADLAPRTRGMIVSVGLPLYHRKALYNVACLLVDGVVAGFVAKQFLAGDGIHYEPRWFKNWPAGKRTQVTIAGRAYPLGDLCFDCGGVRIGFEICEDAWVANRPGSDLALRGVDVILNPSASHFAFHKFGVRQRFVTEGSRAFAVAYLYANLLGNEAGRIIYDGGAIMASAGRLLARGARFSFADMELTCAVIDIDENRVDQVRRGSHRPFYDDSDAGSVSVPFQYPAIAPEFAPDVAPEDRVPVAASWEDSPDIEEEEFTRAVSLGLFDYLRKSRSHGFVVSLSGGADSAATAVLCALAVDMALRQIGLDRVRARLSHIPGVAEVAHWTVPAAARRTAALPSAAGAPVAPAEAARALVSRLLMCVYQATENSSTTTYEAARQVAEAIGAEFVRLDIDPVIRDYLSMVSAAVGRELTWERDDIALQNIQARARGPGVWMLANLRNALLLATSNRSEAAVGYATMDGDTCGGLSPIAGIDKAFLRSWLSWMERVGPAGLEPMPVLAAITVQTPTAELRPLAAAQTDEDDLMPYPLLDAIESAAIGAKHTPLEVFVAMRARFPGYSAGQLGVWIERFFRLWCRNQWKRERYAPSFHVDDKSLDPKSWCRFPILSGGFERELAELRDYISRLARE